MGQQYLAMARRFIEKAFLLEYNLARANGSQGGEQEQAANPSGTLINFGCVLSNQGRHIEALAKANDAINLLEAMEDQGLAQAPVTVDGSPATSQLAVAYHNKAVELNFLGRYSEALVTHERAVEVGREQVGQSHTMVARIENGLLDAMRLQREGAWQMRGPRDPDVWGIVTTADRSIGGGQLRPIGPTPQGPVTWSDEAISMTKKSFHVTPGQNYEDLLRPHSSIGIGPKSLTIPDPEGRSILNTEDIWATRQKAQWRIDYSKGIEYAPVPAKFVKLSMRKAANEMRIGLGMRKAMTPPI